MKIQTAEPTFKTAEFYLICFLLTSGCEVKDWERSTSRVFALFKDPDKCEQLQKDFINGKGLVEPRKYADSIRSMKAFLKTGERE